MYIYWTPKIRRFVRPKREREANSWLQTKKKDIFPDKCRFVGRKDDCRAEVDR